MSRETDKDGYPTVCFVCGERVLATKQNGFHLAMEKDGQPVSLSAHLLCYLSYRREAAVA